MAITGKPGLYKVVSQNNRSIVVETLDSKKVRMPVHPSYQVALLEEITVYTMDDTELKLSGLFKRIEEMYKTQLPVTVKDNPEKIRDFMLSVAPEHDYTRVYTSDITKVIKWYNILLEFGEQVEESGTETSKTEETVVENNSDLVDSIDETAVEAPKKKAKKTKTDSN